MKWPTSDHFNGKRFFYPGADAGRGFGDVIRWRLTSKATPWPPVLPPPHPVLPVPPPPFDGSVALTWIGHATFLIQTAVGTWLSDPFFSGRAGPTARIGAKRAMPPAFGVESLPALSGVLLSHDHYDHCDLPALRAIAARAPAGAPISLYSPLGYAALSGGLALHELDWWQTVATAGATLQLVPARHWCRRTIGGRNVRLWGGFILKLPAKTIYFAGDTGYDEPLFRAIAARCGPIDLAFLPIGAYEPRWFMRDAHMNPAEAVQAHRHLGAKQSIAMHWGTIQLTDEGYDDPPKDLAIALATENIPESAFRVLSIGERVIVP